MTSETNDDDVPVLNNNNNDDADADDEAKEEVTDLSSRYVHDTPFDLLYLYVMGDTPWFPTHTFTSHTPHYLNTHTHFTSLPQHSLPPTHSHITQRRLYEIPRGGQNCEFGPDGDDGTVPGRSDDFGAV